MHDYHQLLLAKEINTHQLKLLNPQRVIPEAKIPQKGRILVRFTSTYQVSVIDNMQVSSLCGLKEAVDIAQTQTQRRCKAERQKDKCSPRCDTSAGTQQIQDRVLLLPWLLEQSLSPALINGKCTDFLCKVLCDLLMAEAA